MICDLAGRVSTSRNITTSGAEQLFAGATLRRFGIVGTSSLDTALEALAKKEVLVREGRRVTFDNPYFRRWVRRVVLEG